MFQSNEPKLKQHTILKANVLESGLVWAQRYMETVYEGYADGIISGVDITASMENLHISPGIILHGKHLYYMQQPVEIPYRIFQKQVYIRVVFFEEEIEENMLIRSTDIILSDVEESRNNEMEIGRFYLERGAQLRTEYINLQDCITMHDTLNLLYVPYASKGGSTIAPGILKEFGREVVINQPQQVLDASVGLKCLNQEPCSRDMLIEYIKNRNEGYDFRQDQRRRRALHQQDHKMTNDEIFEQLMSIVNDIKKNKPRLQENRQERRVIID